jgi:antitoxin (DNA-binding transcriptional repressor) of toxin-antitoxin stability system
MDTMPMTEAQARLPELITKAIEGEDIVIAVDASRAIRLVPVTLSERPRFGSGRGMFVMADDFDAPLEEVQAYEL